MDLVHKVFEVLEHFGVLPQPLSPESIADRCDAGDDEANVVVGSFKEEFCCFLVEVTARKFKPTEERSATHRAHHDTVFDLNVANFPRCK